jgi:DNA repair exonuclease SbcCD ATPase subunit
MNNFIIQNIHRNEIRRLSLAINNLLREKDNLNFSDNEEALDDVYKIMGAIKNLKSRLNRLRINDTRIMGLSRNQSAGRDGGFESQLGHLLLLQNQLNKLESSLQGIEERILRAINHPANVGQRIQEHLNEIKQKKDTYKQFPQMHSSDPQDAVLNNIKPQIPDGGDILLACASLCTLIFSFKKKSKSQQ